MFLKRVVGCCLQRLYEFEQQCQVRCPEQTSICSLGQAHKVAAFVQLGAARGRFLVLGLRTNFWLLEHSLFISSSTRCQCCQN